MSTCTKTNATRDVAAQFSNWALALEYQADLLGNDKVQLLAAYVYSLSKGPDQLVDSAKAAQ